MVKGPSIYIPPLTRKPEQQQFTIWSGVLTGTSSKRHIIYIQGQCWHSEIT